MPGDSNYLITSQSILPLAEVEDEVITFTSKNWLKEIVKDFVSWNGTDVDIRKHP